MFSIGEDPYRKLDLRPEFTVGQERLMAALRGSHTTIGAIGRVEPRGLPGDLETLRAYQEVDAIVRKTSVTVEERKQDIGAARYVRWGNFCLSWLEVRQDLPLSDKSLTLPSRISAGRAYAMACADELARLPATGPAPAPTPTATAAATPVGWKRLTMFAGVTAGVILLLRRVFHVGEQG